MGLVPFSEQDAPFFFGREEWREIIIDNLRAYRLTLLYGESGVGKTSVLRAGAAHALGERALRARERYGSPGHAVVVYRSWRDDPLQGLVASARRAVADSLGEPPQSDEPIGAPDLIASLEECTQRVGGKIFVILDQFEEYFLYHPDEPDERGFATALADAVNRRDLRTTFLISVREDQLAKLDRFKARLPSLFDNYLRIEQLDREEAQVAIVEPLAEYNRRSGQHFSIEPPLIDAILDEVASGKVIVGTAGAGVIGGVVAPDSGRIETPYLQLVLSRLWDEEQGAGGSVLRLSTFDRLGGARGIVRTHLDTAMGALPVPAQDTAAQLFNYLVTPSGTKIAQRASDLANYAAVPETDAAMILEKLSGELRILRPVGDSNYEIYHDALAAPILDWRTRRQIEQQRRRERRRLSVLAGVALLAVLVAAGLIVLTLIALSAKDRAQRESALVNQAASRDLATLAIQRLRSGSDQALATAVAAFRRAPTSQAEGALRATLAFPNLTAVLRTHTDMVHGAVLSPDGRIAITTDDHGASRVWRTDDGALVASLAGGSIVTYNGNPIGQSPAFSPDGQFVVSAGSDGSARVWDARNWRLIAELNSNSGGLFAAAFSADGTRAVTAGRRGARVWDVSQRRIVAALGVRATLDAAFSHDGRLVVTEGTDSVARVWDAATGRSVAVLGTPQRPLGQDTWVPHVGAALSPDGRLALSLGPDGKARIWDVTHRRLVRSPIAAQRGSVNSATFSSDGRQFVTVGDDGWAQVYASATGRRIARLHHSGQVVTAAFSPDGTRLLTAADDGTARVWDLATKRRLAILTAQPGGAPVFAATFSSDGTRILAGGEDGTARVWSAPDEDAETVLPRPLGGASRAVLNPDGKLVATLPHRGPVRIWQAGTGRLVAALPGTVGSPDPQGAFSADGRVFLAVERNGASTWDTTSWRRLTVLGDHGPSRPVIAAIGPNGSQAATVGADRIVRIWNAQSGAMITTLPRRDDSVRGGVLFSPDGQLLLVAAGSRDSVWRLNEREPSLVDQLPDGVYVATFSPDSRMIATADGGIRIWDASTGRSLAHMRGGGSPDNIGFSSDGEVVAAVNGDRVSFWNAATGKPLAGPPRSVSFPGNGRLAGQLSRDGRVLLSLSLPRPIAIHDVRPIAIHDAITGQSLAELPGGAYDAVISRDDSRVVATGLDGVVRIYPCDVCGPIEHVLALAQARLLRSRAEARQRR